MGLNPIRDSEFFSLSYPRGNILPLSFIPTIFHLISMKFSSFTEYFRFVNKKVILIQAGWKFSPS